jgi:hypothetical protein
LETVGSKKKYYLNLEQDTKWNSIEIAGSVNAQRGDIRYPTKPTATPVTVRFQLDGDMTGRPGDDFYARSTDFAFGVKTNNSVRGGSFFFAPNISGYGTEFQYEKVTRYADQEVPGTVVRARQYTNSQKYSTKNTGIINTGRDVTFSGEQLVVGTRGYAAYQLIQSLKKTGYKDGNAP